MKSVCSASLHNLGITLVTSGRHESWHHHFKNIFILNILRMQIRKSFVNNLLFIYLFISLLYICIYVYTYKGKIYLWNKLSALLGGLGLVQSAVCAVDLPGTFTFLRLYISRDDWDLVFLLKKLSRGLLYPWSVWFQCSFRVV